MTASSGRVLYCEHNPDTRALMAILLERAGFEAVRAKTAGECLALAGRGGPFDLYLLGHTFPDASGVAVCEALRRFDPATPILLYSAGARPEERDAAIRAGAQDYLTKPEDLFEVADQVARWIAAKRAPPERGLPGPRERPRRRSRP